MVKHLYEASMYQVALGLCPLIKVLVEGSENNLETKKEPSASFLHNRSDH